MPWCGNDKENAPIGKKKGRKENCLAWPLFFKTLATTWGEEK